jgi:hypothetical protein
MIVAQETSQSLATSRRPSALSSHRPRKLQQVTLRLMVPLGMEAVDILAQRPSLRPLAKQDHPGKALLLDRPDPALGVGIQVRAPRRLLTRWVKKLKRLENQPVEQDRRGGC